MLPDTTGRTRSISCNTHYRTKLGENFSADTTKQSGKLSNQDAMRYYMKCTGHRYSSIFDTSMRDQYITCNLLSLTLRTSNRSQGSASVFLTASFEAVNKSFVTGYSLFPLRVFPMVGYQVGFVCATPFDAGDSCISSLSLFVPFALLRIGARRLDLPQKPTRNKRSRRHPAQTYCI